MAGEGRGRVEGRVAMVTGGAGGIGSATVRALAREGASVAVLDIDAAGAERVAGEIRHSGGAALAVAVDLSDEPAVVGAVRSVVDRFGRLDILHNNAALTESDALDARHTRDRAGPRGLGADAGCQPHQPDADL